VWNERNHAKLQRNQQPMAAPAMIHSTTRQSKYSATTAESADQMPGHRAREQPADRDLTLLDRHKVANEGE
jgi:hypothetical protein